jgi:Holliday junction resolvasome RuvABC DNA-binding subunit
MDLGIAENIAKKVARRLDPKVKYTVSQIAEEIVNAGEARMATRQVKEVAEKLKEMGFIVNESWLVGYKQFLFERESTQTDS